MLFVDRIPVSSADLAAVDPALPKVIATEDAGNADNIIARAISECVNDLLAAMTSYESYPGGGDISSNHLAAVLSIYGTRNVPRLHMSQLCLNPRVPNTWSPVKNWLTHYVASEIYQAAWNTKLKDEKYETKARVYKAEAERYFRLVRATGLPLLWNPLIAPAAAYEANTGTWTASNLGTASRPGAAGGTFTVAVTWVDQRAYQTWVLNGNAESHPSVDAAVTVPSGSALAVNINSLNPPTGFDFRTYGFAQGVTFPRPASGWNLYVNGVLQNASPIPVATKTYTLSGDPAATGYRVGIGQHPDVYTVMPSGPQVFRG